MAINSLSFCGTGYREPVRRTGTSATRTTRSASGDTFTRTTNTQKSKKKSGYSPLVRAGAKVLIPVVALSCAYNVGKNAQMNEYMEAPYGIVINAEQSYESLSQTTKIPLNVLLWANGAENKDEIPKKAVIPNEYDITFEKRMELAEKISSSSGDKKAAYERELEELIAKKELQDELVTVYINDDNEVLMVPNNYASCEEVKEAFDIKDGVIKKYNEEKLSYSWGVDGFEGRGYRDYTGAMVPSDGIVLPLDKIGN